MNHLELNKLLEILKLARAYLIERTCKEEPELFKKLYQFENNLNLLNLSFEQEFIDWINYHFELANSRELLSHTDFLKAILNLMKVKTPSDNATLNETSSISIEILNQKRKIIQSIIDMDINNEKNYQRLLFFLEKDKALFQREFNQLLLSEKKNGNIG